jgi:hypothetical protein
MSQRVLLDAIGQMEAWLDDPNWEPEPEALLRWNEGFCAAELQVPVAERQPDLVARAHAVGERVEVRTAQLAKLQDAMRSELEVQERGNRALRGYGSSTS